MASSPERVRIHRFLSLPLVIARQVDVLPAEGRQVLEVIRSGFNSLFSQMIDELQFRCIEFLREASKPFHGQIPSILISGIVGPRGDAYALNREITENSAEDYHSIQLEALSRAKVDCVSALTFNSVPEAMGVARAAARANLRLAVPFTLDSTSKLKSGPTLREAIEATDRNAGDAKPDFYGINCSLGDLGKRYAHIDIWGGCCGTSEKHLEQIAGRVKQIRGQSGAQ